MPAFTGTLNSNEIFAALYNMIISQQVFADNLVHNNNLVDKFKVDGTLYGDTKLYYATDVLKSAAWGNDAEATNLLTIYRPKAPSCQAIKINNFRQICLTVDNYLSKRAWSTEGAFSNFTSVMLGWMRETRALYENVLFNVYLGTTKATTGDQDVTIDVTTAVGATTGIEKARLTGLTIAQAVANLFVKLKDYSRSYNDYEYMRSYNQDDFYVIWNADYLNEIIKLDLPTVFHKDVIDFQNSLPSRFFGTVNDATKTTADADTHSLIEQDVTYSGTTYHLFPGDIVPTGATIAASSAVTVPSYQLDNTIIAKVVHKNGIPFMSAFEVGTSFFNPKSLTETHYLTWGYSTLEYLKNYPFITLIKA